MKSLFYSHVRYFLREDLTFSYLIGTKLDLESQREVDSEEASDFAYNHELLYNEVSSLT